MLKTLNNIQLEMKMIQLQLYFAKRATKKQRPPKTTLIEVESHINHSLHSLNHLISHIDDFKQMQSSNTLLITEQRKHNE